MPSNWNVLFYKKIVSLLGLLQSDWACAFFERPETLVNWVLLSNWGEGILCRSTFVLSLCKGISKSYWYLGLLVYWEVCANELDFCHLKASCQRRFREANLRCIAELDKRGRDALFASNVVGGDEDEGLRRRQRSALIFLSFWNYEHWISHWRVLSGAPNSILNLSSSRSLKILGGRVYSTQQFTDGLDLIFSEYYSKYPTPKLEFKGSWILNSTWYF